MSFSHSLIADKWRRMRRSILYYLLSLTRHLLRRCLLIHRNLWRKIRIRRKRRKRKRRKRRNNYLVTEKCYQHNSPFPVEHWVNKGPPKRPLLRHPSPSSYIELILWTRPLLLLHATNSMPVSCELFTFEDSDCLIDRSTVSWKIWFHFHLKPQTGCAVLRGILVYCAIAVQKNVLWKLSLT